VGLRQSRCLDQQSQPAAETLQVSAGTLMRNWRLTKVWLLKELRGNQ
jgi:hypothetical protein